ncbi:GlyGly-CTERM sorting domain-containing protein [Sphingomonas sp. UV9]|nr:GlyGly-CTERM sorting domain-containing protein [Sphingomonas sp. UV9]
MRRSITEGGGSMSIATLLNLLCCSRISGEG